MKAPWQRARERERERERRERERERVKEAAEGSKRQTNDKKTIQFLTLIKNPKAHKKLRRRRG